MCGAPATLRRPFLRPVPAQGAPSPCPLPRRLCRDRASGHCRARFRPPLPCYRAHVNDLQTEHKVHFEFTKRKQQNVFRAEFPAEIIFPAPAAPVLGLTTPTVWASWGVSVNSPYLRTPCGVNSAFGCVGRRWAMHTFSHGRMHRVAYACACLAWFSNDGAST